MTAKEYLNQIRDLDLEIQLCEIKIDKINKEEYSLQSFRFNSVSSKSNIFSSCVENSVINRDAEIQINIDKIERLKDKKDIIHNKIAEMTDTTLRYIIFLRYEEYLEFNEIAEKMNYSERQILRLHKNALFLLENIINS